MDAAEQSSQGKKCRSTASFAIKKLNAFNALMFIKAQCSEFREHLHKLLALAS